MKITLDIRKTLEDNAAVYFDKSKKAKGKISGAQKAILKARENLEKSKKTPIIIKSKSQIPKKIRKRSWYEKFKWFFASNGMLVIGGRDATTNEIVIKKHVDKTDIVIHTDAPGSPFIVVKSEGEKISKDVIQEAIDFCACHSKAWKLGLKDVEVYWVNPEQVTKEAKAGEYMSKGSFMVYGDRNYVRPNISLAAVSFEDKIMVAPFSSFKGDNSDKVIVKIDQGDVKTSDTAKKVISLLGTGDVDDVVPLLPAGTFSVKKLLLNKVNKINS